MEFVSKNNAGLASVTCMMSVSVTIVTGQVVYSTMSFYNVSAELGQVDTAVNVPSTEPPEASLTVGKFAHELRRADSSTSSLLRCCLMFEGNVEDIESTASETWLAMPFPLSEKTRYGCITNDCEAGTQCIKTNTGPICATLPA